MNRIIIERNCIHFKYVQLSRIEKHQQLIKDTHY